MSVSIVGLIGAVLGLYLAWIDQKILKGILQAAEMKNREGGGDGGIAARYRAPLTALIVVVPMVGFPIVGYWAGASLAG
ncbi:conserved hypothetical protein [Roseibium sp. TrichSKD4]|uniref:hypothetical protein n=1 Tax=Roseibium sp. TrichSKD4 TaxID=744980 RepID=UPI0001E566CE|nr:hypothetical protein [Roseibium sp. TrichSKD4]EFO33622.1 conserved hypothetical protein [Roseibium sp. TrichSKD4]